MKKLYKFKKYLFLVLGLNLLNILLFFIWGSFIGIDLPLSKEKINFLYNKLIIAEQNYKNNTNLIDCYEYNSFKLMLYSDYKASKFGKNVCKFEADVVLVTKTSLMTKYVLYHDIIDNCCYGYYAVTYNPADNTALCIYMDKPLFTINLSRTELIKTND